MRRNGFTLLEVVIAIIILSVFAVACLQLRFNGLRAAKQIEESQRAQRAIDDVLALAVNRMLPDPIVDRDDEGIVQRITWRGDYLGAPYECVSEVIAAAPPLMERGAEDDSEESASMIRVQRYTVTMLGETAEMLMPIRRRS